MVAEPTTVLALKTIGSSGTGCFELKSLKLKAAALHLTKTVKYDHIGVNWGYKLGSYVRTDNI